MGAREIRVPMLTQVIATGPLSTACGGQRLSGDRPPSSTTREVVTLQLGNERRKQYIPWCKEALVLSARASAIQAWLALRYGPLRYASGGSTDAVDDGHGGAGDAQGPVFTLCPGRNPPPMGR